MPTAPVLLVGQVLEVERVLEWDQLLAAIIQLDDDKAVALDHAESTGIKKARIAYGLHPGVVVGNQIAIVVKALANRAEVIPYALCADGAWDAWGAVRPPA